MKRRRTSTKLNLHDDGCTVVRRAILVDAHAREAFATYARRHDRAIFNHQDDRVRQDGGHGRNDQRRRQCTLRSNRTLPVAMRAVLRSAEAFLGENSEWCGGRTPSAWALLRSLPGCARQAAHADYVPTPALCRASDAEMPLAVLVALQDETTLDVWPRSIRCIGADTEELAHYPLIQRHTVALSAGDVLVFRGDLVHAGSAYDAENVRLHMYLDSAHVPREPNRTWLIDVHASDELRRICVA